MISQENTEENEFNEFDEFDEFSDFDEADDENMQDDHLGEEDSDQDGDDVPPKLKAKKKSGAAVKLVVTILLAGTVSGAGWFFYSQQSQNNTAPVIKIENMSSTDEILTSGGDNIVAVDAQILSEENSLSNDNLVGSLIINHNDLPKNANQQGVLTPFPDDVNTSNIILPELSSLDKALNSNANENISDEQANTTQNTVLEDDKFLAETDKVFESLSDAMARHDEIVEKVSSDDVVNELPPTYKPEPDNLPTFPSEVSSVVTDDEAMAFLFDNENPAQPPTGVDLVSQKPAVKDIAASDIITITSTAAVVPVIEDVAEIDVELAKIIEPAKKAIEPLKVIEGVEKTVEQSAIKKPQPLPPPQWVLRSAQPERATILDKRSGQILSVEQGDKVNGLGTIKSIKKIGGKWVIQGSLNKVTQ